jgi:hypothetical protein
MFVHPTADYDFIIHLKPSMVTRYTQNLFANSSVWGAGKLILDPSRPHQFTETPYD